MLDHGHATQENLTGAHNTQTHSNNEGSKTHRQKTTITERFFTLDGQTCVGTC